MEGGDFVFPAAVPKDGNVRKTRTAGGEDEDEDNDNNNKVNRNMR